MLGIKSIAALGDLLAMLSTGYFNYPEVIDISIWFGGTLYLMWYIINSYEEYQLIGSIPDSKMNKIEEKFRR